MKNFIPDFLCAVAISSACIAGTVDEGSKGFRYSGYAELPLQIEPYPHAGQMIQKKIIDALPLSVTTYDWIVHSSIRCQVNWDQRCEGTIPVEAPQGWQACKRIYTVAGQSQNAGFSVTPSGWYTNDLESPDRFRSYDVFLYAYGSGRIFDQWGANMDLTNVGLRIIRADAINSDRYSAGCEMPAHD